MKSSSPSSSMVVFLLFLLLPALLLLLSTPAQAHRVLKGGCLNYGHSCLGAHGKRGSLPALPPPNPARPHHSSRPHHAPHPSPLLHTLLQALNTEEGGVGVGEAGTPEMDQQRLPWIPKYNNNKIMGEAGALRKYPVAAITSGQWTPEEEKKIQEEEEVDGGKVHIRLLTFPRNNNNNNNDDDDDDNEGDYYANYDDNDDYVTARRIKRTVGGTDLTQAEVAPGNNNNDLPLLPARLRS